MPTFGALGKHSFNISSKQEAENLRCTCGHCGKNPWPKVQASVGPYPILGCQCSSLEDGCPKMMVTPWPGIISPFLQSQSSFSRHVSKTLKLGATTRMRLAGCRVRCQHKAIKPYIIPYIKNLRSEQTHIEGLLRPGPKSSDESPLHSQTLTLTYS